MSLPPIGGPTTQYASLTTTPPPVRPGKSRDNDGDNDASGTATAAAAPPAPKQTANSVNFTA